MPFRRQPDRLPISERDWYDLVRMIMRMDDKLDLIVAELEIEGGEEED